MFSPVSANDQDFNFVPTCVVENGATWDKSKNYEKCFIINYKPFQCFSTFQGLIYETKLLQGPSRTIKKFYIIQKPQTHKNFQSFFQHLKDYSLQKIAPGPQKSTNQLKIYFLFAKN